MSNLSLLSRGTGQVVRKKQEKLEVHFDPEDYLNWKPPETGYHVSRLLDDSQVVEGFWRLCLPKTYSTRTGALVLYSEDLAKPSLKLKRCRKSQRRLRNKSRTLHIELRTLQDLVRAILAYGGKQVESGSNEGHMQGGEAMLWRDKKRMTWQPYLHFLSDPDIQTERQMRPGYSAKRYLLKLSQTWDPSILRKLQCAGYIKDPLLLEENLPDHRKKLQDLSAVPPKYNLLHIFCSPCSYLQTELEEQATNPVHSPLFYKQPENKARLVEDYEEGGNAKGKTRIPLRISVRRLSFHLRPQHTKESTWSQNTAHIGIPEDRWVGVHQDGKTAKEDPGHSEIPKQTVDYPPLGSINNETSELWCEKSHVTFYGGFFPGRKISYSVNQRHLKNSKGKERGPPVGTGLLPPIQPGTSAERGGVMKEHRDQVLEIFRLPQISEDWPRAHRKKIKSGELTKELVILPLLVHLEREPQTKAKRPREACCNVPNEVDVCNEQLASLPNDLILETEHRRNEEQQQMINGGISEASQGSFCLPPINNGQSQTECHNGTSLSSLCMSPDREIVCPSVLGSIQTTDDPEQFGFIPDEEGDGEVSLETRRTVSVNPSKISSEVQEQQEKESPGIQRTKLSRPRDERQIAVKKEAIQLIATPKNGGSAPCAAKRLDPSQTQQAGKVQGSRDGFETVQNNTGSKSISTESRKESQQGLDGFSRNHHLQLSKDEKGRPTLPQTQSTKQKNFIQDTGEQLDNLSPTSSLSHLEPHPAHLMVAASEMEIGWESEGASLDLLEPGKEIKESPRVGTHPSAKQFGTEEETTTLSEKTSKQAQATSVNRAEGVLEKKPMSRQKKHELVKTSAASKAQKKSTKKDKRQSRTEFVVGKPRQKKAVGETVTSSKQKPAGVKRSETAEEENQEEEKEGGDVELEQIGSLVEGGGDDDEKEDLRGPSEQSLGSSTPLNEEQPSLLKDSHPLTEDVGQTPGSPAGPASETPLDTCPAVSTANGSQTDAVQSSGLTEDLPVNKEEEKLSRGRMIAERAEKRRLAVERKRREQEEQKRKEQEQQERMERMKEEMGHEHQRRIEEMRLRRQQQEEERQRQEEEAARKHQAEKAAQERARQQQEEHRRKLLEMQKKKQEEERERAEAEKRKQKEREIWLEEERQRLAEMAEEQRLEYEKRKREEEEKAKREAEERRRRDEEEARIALEEARKQALLLARQRAELEKQHQFQYKLLAEASGLERGQEISRPWVYSYFQHPFLKVGDDD